jgi:hypothetical protein
MSKYNFTFIGVDIYDAHWKGVRIGWCCEGIGCGELLYGFNSDLEFDVDTEDMSQEFVSALLVEAAPELAKILMDRR